MIDQRLQPSPTEEADICRNSFLPRIINLTTGSKADNNDAALSKGAAHVSGKKQHYALGLPSP